MSLAALAKLAHQALPRQAGDTVQYVRPFRHLGVFRQHRPSSLEATLYEPTVVLVLQGRKETVLGTNSFLMGPGECLLVSHDLPVVARVLETPYLALLFDLEVNTLRDVYESIGDSPRSETTPQSLAVHTSSPPLLDAFRRYLELVGQPLDAAVLEPFISHEIHYRLATAPVGSMMRELIRQNSHASAISRALKHLRRDFRSPVEIPQLARSVGMSTSSFHKHFKAITASSPLQYRKSLQLLEARRLLRTGAHSVSATAFDVGYESAAQFSRDYKRCFGTSPKDDVPI